MSGFFEGIREERINRGKELFSSFTREVENRNAVREQKAKQKASLLTVLSKRIEQLNAGDTFTKIKGK